MENRKVNAVKKQKNPRTRCRFYPACKHGNSCAFVHPTKPCRDGLNCKRGPGKCRFLHDDGDLKEKTEPEIKQAPTKAEGTKLDFAEAKEPEANPPKFPRCWQCGADIPRQTKISHVKAEDATPEPALKSEGFPTPANLKSEGTHHKTPTRPEPDDSAAKRKLFASPGVENLTNALNSMKIVTPQSFEKPRPESNPRDLSIYRGKQRIAEENQKRHEVAFIVCNWGISTAAHKIVQKPTLRELCMQSYNTPDLGNLAGIAHLVRTDKGGSVVRFEFTIGPHFTAVEVAMAYQDIVEFASKIHNRLVAEFLFKATPVPADEIVVYYACPNGPSGYFTYNH
jgi:hypothetical protein